MNDDRPLRIALVRIAAHRRGGVERYVWGFARDLAARGHEVHLFARHWEALPGSIIWRPVGRLGGLSVLKAWSFARGVENALRGELLRGGPLRGERFDAVYNFDRAPVRGIYRAGEGCHREWLRVAAAHLPPRLADGQTPGPASRVSSLDRAADILQTGLHAGRGHFEEGPRGHSPALRRARGKRPLRGVCPRRG